MQVVDADDVLDRLVAEVVGRPVDVAALEAAAGQPEREAVAVVVAAVGPLRDRQSGRTRPSRARSSSRAARAASGRAPGPRSAGRSSRQTPLVAFAFLLCVSQGWPLRKTLTKRTPRSTSRRASRQRVPYCRGLRVVEAVQRAGRRGLAGEVEGLGDRVCIRAASSKLAIRASSSVFSGWRPRCARSARRGSRADGRGPPGVIPAGVARFRTGEPPGAERGPLVDRGEPAARPVVRAVDRQPAGVGQDDVRRQVLGSPSPGRRSPTTPSAAGRRRPLPLWISRSAAS